MATTEQLLKKIWLSYNDEYYVLNCPYRVRHVAKQVGFWFDNDDRLWKTKDPLIAQQVVKYAITKKVRDKIEADVKALHPSLQQEFGWY